MSVAATQAAVAEAAVAQPAAAPPAVAQAPPPCCPKDATTDKEAVLWHKLEVEIREIDAHLDGVMGVAIEDLSTGHTLFLNPDEILPHVMGGLTPGVTRVTNRDLATMVVAVSDNSAANVLIDRLGMKNVNAFLESLGLHQMRLRRKMMDLQAAAEGRENVATPREMMTLLDVLFHNKVFNRPLTDDFFKILATPKDSWIPRLLPEDLKIANKPGSLEGVRNDAGVIFARRPYILCVMTTYLRNERDGEEAIAQISRAAYRMFDRLGRASALGRVISPANGSN
jgi:beta-lactamase class A